MAIAFPTSIIPNFASELRPVRGRWQNQSPYTQGTQEKITSSFLYEITFGFPPLTNAQMDLVRSVRDQGGEIIMPLYRPFEAALTSGSIVVASGSSGNSLNVSGVNSAYAPKAGRPLSILAGGRWYVYTLLSDSAAGSSTRTFTLTQPLRASVTIGDVIAMEFGVIQGFAEWELPSNSINTSGFYDGLKVTIREAK